MMGDNDKITNGQNMFVLIATMIGVGILSLPRSLVEEFGTDGWITIIWGGIIVSILTIIMTKLLQMYEGKTMVEIGRELVPTPIASIISILNAIRYIVASSYVVRIFAEVVKMFLLNNTPTEVVIISILLTSSYLARKGIESIGRIMQLIIPIVIIPLVLLLLPIMTEINIENALPIFRTNILDIMKGSRLIFFSYLGFEVITYTMPYIKKSKNSLKYSLMAVWSVTGIYTLTFFITLTRFGKDEMLHLLWPTLSLMKTIDIPGIFIENVEGIVMSLWVFMVFATIVTYHYFTALIVSKVTREKGSRHFVLPVVPIIYFLSLIPDNIAITYDYVDVFIKYVGTFTVVIVPIVYYLIAIFKNRKKTGVSNDA